MVTIKIINKVIDEWFSELDYFPEKFMKGRLVYYRVERNDIINLKEAILTKFQEVI